MYHPIEGGTQIELRYGGYKVWLPPKPSASEIAGFHLKKSEQYFRRTVLPDFWEERSAEEEAKREPYLELWESGQIKYEELYTDQVLEEFRRKEWHKRLNGYWFYNNGKPIYITGTHYYYLTWTHWDHAENDGYPVFYENQVDRFYFRKLCETDPNCLGYIKLGPRGFGKSTEELACILDRMTMPPRQKRAYIQSKTDDDAKLVLFQNKLVPAFNSLPDFFKPKYDHGTAPTKSMSFKRPRTTGKNAAKVKFKPEFELLNLIECAGAGEVALDGETAQEIMNDEIGKSKPHVVRVDKRIKVNRFCVFRNNTKVGIIRAVSTVEDLDEGGKECKKVWDTSDPEQLTPNKQTISGLYRWRESILDVDKRFADEYGVIDPKRRHPDLGVTVEEYHFAERKSREHDHEEHADWIRKNPIFESDMWTKKPGSTAFNAMRLTQYKNELIKHPHLWIRGNFHWEGKPFDSPVRFERDDHGGRWQMAVTLENQDNHNTYGKSNLWGKDYNYSLNREELIPMNKSRYVMGCDPIKDIKTKDPRASKMSAHIKFKYNDNLDRGKPIKDWVSNRYVAKYLHRPEDPTDAYLDVAMGMLYFGTWGNIETNVSNFHTWLREKKMTAFIMTALDFEEGQGFESKVNNEEGLQSTTAVQQAYINKLRSAFKTNLPDRINYLPFIDSIDCCIDFDPKEWTKFDDVVSLGYTELGDDAIVEENYNENENLTSINEWFASTDEDGNELPDHNFYDDIE